MRQKSSYRIGTGASSLLMILVVLCLTALSVLSYVTASSELTVSRRATEVTEQVYAAMDEGYAFLSDLDAALLAVSGEDDYLAAAREKAAALPYAGVSVTEDEVRVSFPATDKLSVQVVARLRPLGESARYDLVEFSTVTQGGDAECWD